MEEDTKFVELQISADYGFTADVLREIANYIEECGGEPTQFESWHGVAEIKWPD